MYIKVIYTIRQIVLYTIYTSFLTLILCAWVFCLHVCLYTTCVLVLVEARSEHQILKLELHMAVCHHINAGNLTQTLWEISQ